MYFVIIIEKSETFLLRWVITQTILSHCWFIDCITAYTSLWLCKMNFNFGFNGTVSRKTVTMPGNRGWMAKESSELDKISQMPQTINKDVVRRRFPNIYKYLQISQNESIAFIEQLKKVNWKQHWIVPLSPAIRRKKASFFNKRYLEIRLKMVAKPIIIIVDKRLANNAIKLNILRKS